MVKNKPKINEAQSITLLKGDSNGRGGFSTEPHSPTGELYKGPVMSLDLTDLDNEVGTTSVDSGYSTLSCFCESRTRTALPLPEQ
jgi:hypothetical protein